jgi:glycosyltransferase involved in cell wall biosynthesis
MPPLVSIVTPVHQGADTLSECLDSILSQTYQNWECAIVDNCSTDGSTEIARRYARGDSRMRVCRSDTFRRAIANHNFALKQISPDSKYCKVVFADDRIFPQSIEKMVALAEAHPSVGLVGGYWLEGKRLMGTGLPRTTDFVSGRDICRSHFLDRVHVFGSANAVLYRADLVRKYESFYNEANIHADTEVCFELLKHCDFGFVHDVLSFSRVRRGSLSTISADLNTESPGTLHILLTHGRDYLTDAEYALRLDRHLTDYYEFLGKSLFFRRRDKRFWEYHMRQFERVGFSRSRLLQAMVTQAWRAALNPRYSVERLLARRHPHDTDTELSPAGECHPLASEDRAPRARQIRSNESHAPLRAAREG